MKIVHHLLLISILIAGCFLPIVWLALLFLTFSHQDSERKKRNTNTLKHKPVVALTPRVPTTISKQEYLKSPQWQILRKAVLKRDSYTCQSCQSSSIQLEVHHITYERLGQELLSDLITVCRTCHQAIHDKHGYSYHNTYPVSVLLAPRIQKALLKDTHVPSIH